MANLSAKPPTEGRAAFWVDQEVTAWCHAVIKGEVWVPADKPPERPVLIRKPEVLKRTGLSHFTIWTLERNGRFPKRVRLGEPAEAAD